MDRSLNLIRHMVPFVSTYGWGEQSLWLGAQAAHVSPEEAQVLVGTSVTRMLNLYLHVILEDIEQGMPQEVLTSLPIKARMTALLMDHFHKGVPHKKAIIKTLKVLSNPMNSPLAWHYSTKIMDAFWRQAGDRSTDFNYYTKRLMLGKIYMVTLLVWLRDSSPQLTKTQGILNTQLDMVLKIPALLKRLHALNPFKSRG
jgi:ubiquinone biosynthesis protein COQ9